MIMGHLIIKLRDLGKPSIWAVAYGTTLHTGPTLSHMQHRSGHVHEIEAGLGHHKYYLEGHKKFHN